MEKRPTAIPIVSAFLFAAAAAAAVAGCSLLFPGTLLDRLWELNKPGEEFFRALGRIAGVPLMILGAAMLAAGLGLLRGRNWAWWFAVVLFAIHIPLDVVASVVTGDWLRSARGVLIPAVGLYALTRRIVRRYFAHERQ
ncbi:MAG TPA: DUF2127 domain-containing protein [Bryobacteraceae bacterium]|nr:DUF2127 domain-containing protein [Bryobacteraceae bacterium]